MWINDIVYLKKELEVLVQTKNRKIPIEADLYLELEVVGELNYSSNPEDYAFPDIEINSLKISLQSFHNINKVQSIKIPDFKTNLTVRTDSFDKVIEEYEFIDLPDLNTAHILLSEAKTEAKYEREAA